MKWDETVASRCRYGDVAGNIFGNSNIIWEDSENDYQGHARILAQMESGVFVHYEWSYGSCSYCDEWESRELSGKQIEEEMRREMTVINNVKILKHYIRNTPMDDVVSAWIAKSGL